MYLRGSGGAATRGNREGKGKFSPYLTHWRKWSAKSSGSSRGSLKNN
jgi:hypothetical protein